MADGNDVRRLALALPEAVEDGTSGAYRVDGKLFAWPWMERLHPGRPRVANSQVVAIRVANQGEKEALIALDPETFFTEPHYDGYPAVLVRLTAIAPDLLEKVLTDAWRTRAPRRLVEGRGTS